MTSTYTEAISKAGDRVLDTLKQAEGMAVDAVSTVTKRVGDALPDLPEIPFAERLPRPEEFVKVYFDFVERLIKSQRSYALNLVKAWEPITGKIWSEPKTRKAAAAA